MANFSEQGEEDINHREYIEWVSRQDSEPQLHTTSQI